MTGLMLLFSIASSREMHLGNNCSLSARFHAERNNENEKKDQVDQDSNVKFPWVPSPKIALEFDEQGQVGNQHHQ